MKSSKHELNELLPTNIILLDRLIKFGAFMLDQWIVFCAFILGVKIKTSHSETTKIKSGKRRKYEQ